MDPDNPVIGLCAEGMQAEATGPDGRARELFQEAWDRATDDFEHCIAAHYLARQQDTSRRRLEWNLCCLELADRVGDERVASFYPSLHLNLGRDLEALGDTDSARGHYEAAHRYAGALGDDGYGQMVRAGVEQALARTAPSGR